MGLSELIGARLVDKGAPLFGGQSLLRECMNRFQLFGEGGVDETANSKQNAKQLIVKLSLPTQTQHSETESQRNTHR